MKKKTLSKIRQGIPILLENMDTYSPSLSASKAGFNWLYHRAYLLTIPEVKQKYEVYISKHEHSQNALKGWTW